MHTAIQQITIQIPAIKLIGITCRTNNASETSPSTAKIGPTLQHYFQGALSEKIYNRTQPGTTYCVYTDYASDITGDYTYFVGEVVSSVDTGTLPEGFSQLVIPAQSYTKFTNGPGAMPNVCISVWQKIWSMQPDALGGERAYLADFEVYDERAQDPQNVTLDIYIGIKR